jgi:hypothetical protein
VHRTGRLAEELERVVSGVAREGIDQADVDPVALAMAEIGDHIPLAHTGPDMLGLLELEAIGASPARQRVDAVETIDPVIPACAVHRVVAEPTAQAIGTGAADQRIVAE